MSTQDQIDRLIAVRAGEWYEAIASDDSSASSDEFRRWLGESPKHIDAFMVISGQAPLLREVLRSLPVDADTLRTDNATDVVPLSPPGTECSSPERPRKAPIRFDGSRPTLWISLAAGVVFAALLLWTLVPRWQQLETARGEQRVISLTDGSVVNLNAASLVQVHLSAHSRDLRLVRGEAVFKVAHDRTRPFLVHTPTAVVRAVGTEFAVAIRPEGTTVTVLEGKVEVAPTPLPSSPTQAASAGNVTKRSAVVKALAAGQEARVEGSGSVELDEHPDVARSVAWLQRKIVFRRTSIEDMVAEINRYNGAPQLHIDGVPPGVYRFSGTFNANDPVSLAETVGRETGLSIERRGNDIYIRETGPAP